MSYLLCPLLLKKLKLWNRLFFVNSLLIFIPYYCTAEQISNKTTVVKKSEIPKAKSHEIKLKPQVKKKKNSTEKHEIKKKFVLTRPINYKNNLDAQTGKLLYLSSSFRSFLKYHLR